MPRGVAFTMDHVDPREAFGRLVDARDQLDHAAARAAMRDLRAAGYTVVITDRPSDPEPRRSA